MAIYSDDAPESYLVQTDQQLPDQLPSDQQRPSKQPMHHPLSIQSFFNGYALENKKSSVRNGTLIFEGQTHSLQLPLHYESPTGRHQFKGVIYCCTNGANEQQLFDFSQAIEWLINEYANSTSKSQTDLFKQRVAESDAYVTRASQSIVKRKNFFLGNRSGDLPSSAGDSFIAYEQALAGGHSMHPAPKSCEPLSKEEQKAYLPEFGERFSLQWFAVKTTHLIGNIAQPKKTPVTDSNSSTFTKRDSKEALVEHLHEFFTETVASPPTLPKGWVAIPMHPLQAKAWLSSEEAQTLEHVVKPLPDPVTEASSGWLATSSSRAIFHPNNPWMLKVSLPVKLTNSLRLLTPKEAERGCQLSHLLHSAAGQELQQRTPQVLWLEEPAWCAISDEGGKAIDLSVVSWRQNPFPTLQDGEWAMLATANQPYCPTEEAAIHHWIARVAEHKNLNKETAARLWMHHFMKNVMHPICMARSDYGLVVLAHQQNIILHIENGLPVGAAFRDCQGVGITDLALDRFGDVITDKNDAHRLSERYYYMGRDKVNPFHSYYLLGNTLLNTIATIGASGWVSEQSLLQLCRDCFSLWRQSKPKDPSFYDYLLNSDTFFWKKNVACYLSNQNETSLKDPSHIYCERTNTIAKLADKKALAIWHKPLPGHRMITLVERPSDSLSHTNPQPSQKGSHCLSIRELGHECGDVIIYSHPENKTASLVEITPINDLYIWCSVLEHAFFHLSADAINIACWPSIANEWVQSINQPAEVSTSHQVLKQDFIERAPLWHQSSRSRCALALDSYAITSRNEVATTERYDGSIVEHPIRPPKPNGIIYQRYYYSTGQTLQFRVIDRQRDLAIFHQWHNHPTIAPIWELEGTQEEQDNYLKKLEQDPHQFAVIAELNGVPFGYLELYWALEDRLGTHYEGDIYDRGAHILVGNFNYRGSAIFRRWATGIFHYLYLDNPKTQSIMGEPNAKNQRVIEVTALVGMKKIKEFDFPHKRAALLQSKRSEFFSNFFK